jgi:hypothetical protein
VSKAKVAKTRRQHARIRVIQSLDVGITTIGMEMVVAPNIDVVRKGVRIGFVTKLGNGSSGVPARRNMN